MMEHASLDALTGMLLTHQKARYVSFLPTEKFI